MPSTGPDSRLHVAVGVITRSNGDVLLARRDPSRHQGDTWEFPGGKLEPGEDIRDGLRRELYEELGIELRSGRPLVRLPYNYPDRRVLLDVWLIDAFSGVPRGAEDQEIGWFARTSLGALEMPIANKAIVGMLTLPSLYLISNAAVSGMDTFLSRLPMALDAGASLIQLREPGMSEDDYKSLAIDVIRCCHVAGAQVLLNREPGLAKSLGADGVHLNSHMLMSLNARPLSPEYLVGASCHSLEELRHATRIDTDFVVLSPVNATRSHPNAEPLGWKKFYEFCAETPLPVFALGGMQPQDIVVAREHGAQGLAMISGIWDAPDIGDAVRASLVS
jgi:8-oxo-dGTP diphosphatase